MFRNHRKVYEETGMLEITPDVAYKFLSVVETGDIGLCGGQPPISLVVAGHTFNPQPAKWKTDPKSKKKRFVDKQPYLDG